MKLTEEKYSITNATLTDIPDLVQLINSAYRGDTSRKGWTTEADLLDGIRTDEPALEALITQAGSVILVYRNRENMISGCVNLQKQGDEMYLGMLTVSPLKQGEGIGARLLSASESRARELGCRKMTMQVISIRKELIDWYVRKGYVSSGIKKPFPSDTRFGIPKKPIEFVILYKNL